MTDRADQPAIDKLVDPDFGLIVNLMISSTGSLASALSAYYAFQQRQDEHRARARPVRQNLQSNLETIADAQKRLKTELALLQDVVNQANAPQDLRFRLGMKAYLSPDQFKRYTRIWDQMIRLTQIVGGAMHKIEGIAATGADDNRLEATYRALNHMLKDEHVTINDILVGLPDVMDDLGQQIDHALQALRNQP